jgi:hypothetical protein
MPDLHLESVIAVGNLVISLTLARIVVDLSTGSKGKKGIQRLLGMMQGRMTVMRGQSSLRRMEKESTV